MIASLINIVWLWIYSLQVVIDLVQSQAKVFKKLTGPIYNGIFLTFGPPFFLDLGLGLGVELDNNGLILHWLAGWKSRGTYPKNYDRFIMPWYFLTHRKKSSYHFMNVDSGDGKC